MNIPTPRVQAFTVALLTLATLVLSACGDSDSDSSGDKESTFCTSVDSLKKSVAGLTEVRIDQGALATLQERFAQIQSDLSDVKADAGDEFATEVDGVGGGNIRQEPGQLPADTDGRSQEHLLTDTGLEQSSDVHLQFGVLFPTGRMPCGVWFHHTGTAMEGNTA